MTICTQAKEHLCGEIVDGEMRLNAIGSIVDAEWKRTPMVRKGVELDEFVIMPNHIHGIILLYGEGMEVQKEANELTSRGELQFAPTFRSPSQTIGSVVRGFKSATVKRINELNGTPGARIWQRNYYEHIIKGGRDLNAIRKYIVENPASWSIDEENRLNADRNTMKK